MLIVSQIQSNLNEKPLSFLLNLNVELHVDHKKNEGTCTRSDFMLLKFLQF